MYKENGMNREENEKTIHDQFSTITTAVGYVEDGSYNLDSQEDQVARKLGKLFFDYMIGSMYDVAWEGFSDQELEVIGTLMKDMAVAQEAGL